MATIKFDPRLAHVLGFRHGPRDKVPPAGNVWDYYMMLSPKAPEIAQRTVAAYFPDLVPAALRCSQIPRSPVTLGLLWPDLVSKIRLDRRLGIEFEDVPQWASCDAFPDAYSMTPQAAHALLPDLVDRCGENFFAAAVDLAAEVGIGQVGAMCSHMPIADAGVRRARKTLGIVDNDGWLPGSGFGSGAFVHLAFTTRRNFVHWGRKLVHCEYYPVPPE